MSAERPKRRRWSGRRFALRKNSGALMRRLFSRFLFVLLCAIASQQLLVRATTIGPLAIWPAFSVPRGCTQIGEDHPLERKAPVPGASTRDDLDPAGLKSAAVAIPTGP